MNYNELEDKDFYRNDLEKLARDPNTPSETLDQLADDQDYFVRCWVADNPNSSAKTLEKLSNDKNKHVRFRVAMNPKTHIKIIVKLSNDDFENYKDIRFIILWTVFQWVIMAFTIITFLKMIWQGF